MCGIKASPVRKQNVVPCAPSLDSPLYFPSFNNGIKKYLFHCIGLNVEGQKWIVNIILLLQSHNVGSSTHCSNQKETDQIIYNIMNKWQILKRTLRSQYWPDLSTRPSDCHLPITATSGRAQAKLNAAMTVTCHSENWDTGNILWISEGNWCGEDAKDLVIILNR